VCGIAGIIDFRNQKIDFETLKKMTDVVSHRGPDGEGHWVSIGETVGFGHRRLSIIDLSENGAQPMHFLNFRYTITFNGEIYNYIELKQNLLKKGYVFNTNSDTEVVLASYHDKRENCLNDFDGMFSFAIYDSLNNTVFCARDRFGEKPFHYSMYNGGFYFGSEIKQLWAAGVPKKMDQEKLLNYINSGEIEDSNEPTKTFYSNIKKLNAAHYTLIHIDNPEIHQVKYWDIDLSAPKFSGSIEEAAEEFYSLFKESIRLRLRSDVPVGSSLSGGLDSSSIVMLIDQLKGNEIEQNTFSARFKNFHKDEGEHIQKVVESCKNVKVHYTWPDKVYFEEVFDKVVIHQDEPFGSASIVAQYAVMQLAKEQGVTVLLDGQGADEQLAGYLPYYHQYLNQLFYHSKRKYQIEFQKFNEMHPNFEVHDFAKNRTLRMKLGELKRKLIFQDLPMKNQLSEYLYKDTVTGGLKELLRYADRNSMAHSREVRLPFLSHKLVEFIFSLPDEYKLNNGWTKFVLRKAMTTTLPESICWRVDKIGYEPPQRDWLSNPKWQNEIENSAKFFGVNRILDFPNQGVFTQDWRLLISKHYLS
jgi:asparagine synthase (glutamine-hydrolysing)